MKCSRCRKQFDEEVVRCPNCGEPNPAVNGLYQTSTVFISSGNSDLVYRSVDEVPIRLRTKLLKFTNGRNSATILIADRSGREEIARAIQNLPSRLERRVRKPFYNEPPARALWRSHPRLKQAMVWLLIVGSALLVWGLLTGKRF